MWTLAGLHVLFLVAGATLAHAHVAWVVDERDHVVSDARSTPTLRALDTGDRARAAVLDLSANAVLGGMATGGTGLTILPPYAIGAYRAWIGGIVSIDGAHESRLTHAGSAAYYVSIVALDTAGFVLCGAGGVRAGLAWLPWRPQEAGPRVLGIPSRAWRDLLVLWSLSFPFFAVASAIEFGFAA